MDSRIILAGLALTVGASASAAPIAVTPAPVRQTAPPVPASPGAPLLLTVLTVGGVHSDTHGQGTVEVGPLDPGRTPHPDFHFVLRNDTDKPVPITRLRGSCGCETLLLSKGGKPVPTADLAPHEQVDVSVSVRIAGQHSGLLRKYAWVYGASGDTALATLEIDMTLRDPVAFSPAFLTFSDAAQGSTQSLPLTVTVDSTALAGGGLPNLVSTNPDIRVAPDGPTTRVVRDGKPAVAQGYAVTLEAGTPSGRVAGDLRFAAPTPGMPGGTTFSGQAVPVSGAVRGELSALPRTLFFGSVPAGRTSTRQVVVMAASADRLRGLTVSSGSPWLTAKLDGDTSSVQTVHTLTVTLSAGAPPGPLQAQIVVKASTGNTLVLPVIALLTPPAKG